jgi:hypothetical protein
VDGMDDRGDVDRYWVSDGELVEDTDDNTGEHILKDYALTLFCSRSR